MENVLKKIILKKKEKIQEYKKNNPINKLLASIKNRILLKTIVYFK